MARNDPRLAGTTLDRILSGMGYRWENHGGGDYSFVRPAKAGRKEKAVFFYHPAPGLTHYTVFIDGEPQGKTVTNQSDALSLVEPGVTPAMARRATMVGARKDEGRRPNPGNTRLWEVVDRDKFIDLYMELEITDDQSADLLRRSVEEIEERTQVTDSTQRAIRRLRNLVSRPLAQHGPEAGSWGVMDPKLTAAQRNQVFKIADELGLKLPSYSFNPLKSGWSQKVIRENISEMKDAGRPASQAVAASLDSARRSFRSRHAKKRFPSHLRFLKNPSMTYGDVPPYGDFLKRFCSATDGDDYAMHLKGSDLDAAEETVFSNDGRQAYEPEDTYIGIVQLVEKWEKGDEEAGSLASGILSTLGYEWI